MRFIGDIHNLIHISPVTLRKMLMISFSFLLGNNIEVDPNIYKKNEQPIKVAHFHL